ncbi:hypothetical protein M0R04_06650 [Candidatus Dojkabacteria bacterium]|jgi:hypothetical protein|nr:hypothetical protein [Candidatus Dojkabacteria bacterium]
MATQEAFDKKKFQQLESGLKKQLKQSKTALTPNTQPTLKDLQTQAKLLTTQEQLNKAANDALKLDVYGPKEESDSNLTKLAPPKEGLFTRTLHALGTPLYGIVGAIEAALGKGSKSGLSNIGANIKERGTFGDLLRQYDVNKWVSMPLGLALDITFDPVNWLTAGTTATIPKLFKGVTKGGLEGLGAAAKSAALQKADTLASRIPVLSRRLVSEGVKKDISKKATAAEALFREKAGLPSAVEEIAKISAKYTDKGKGNIGKGIETIGKKIFGEENWEKFRYSPITYAKNLLKRDEERIVNPYSTLDEIKTELALSTDPMTARLLNATRAEDARFFKNTAQDIAYNPPAKGIFNKTNSSKIQSDFSKVSAEDRAVRQSMNTILEQQRSVMDDTGIEWYDKLRKKVFDVQKDSYGLPILKNGKEVLKNPKIAALVNNYERLLGLFKVTKVPLNPTAYTNAVIGNTTFGGMIGLNVLSPDYIKYVNAGRKIINGEKISPELVSLIEGDKKLQQFIRDYKKSLEGLGGSKEMFDNVTSQTLLESIGDDLVSVGKNAGQVFGKHADPNTMFKASSPEGTRLLQRFWEWFAGRDMHKAQILGTASDPFITRDIFYGNFQKWMDDLYETPGKSQHIRKDIVNFLENWSTKYAKVDGSFKLGSLLQLTLDGVTEGELRRIARFVPLSASDITKSGNLFKLTPQAASLVANEAYMNYAAMPAAIRMLRAMPVLGSPFASFAYASAIKTGKTLYRNPALFNKVTFALDEIERGEPQTPLEKTALAGPYYNYLNTYERVKIPFFKEYPLYLNIANMIPYLGMNQFQPSERKYTSSASQAVGSVVDKLPFLKTPEGQVMFDYIIQPWILNESSPTGIFGQPLFKQSDTALEKSLAAGKSLMQAYTPTWLPPGYRFNQVMNAVQGKTPQGIDSSKSGWELLGKSAFSTAGFPVSDINLPYQSSQLKKQIENSAKKK